MVILLSLLFTVAWIWMIVIAFKNNQIIWGIMMIIFSIFPFFFYGIMHWDKGKQPFILGMASIVLVFVFASPAELQSLGNS